MIDLRSDTVTRPSAAMRAAMAAAPVGDDVYGEDPSVGELEAEAATLLGHEAGLFCATGSMANLLGVWLHTPPGTEVLCDSLAHVARAEMGAHGALSGVTMRTWTSEAGRLTAAGVLDMLALDCGPYLVETACVTVEDTVNFAGGAVQDFGEVARLSGELRALGVRTHLDGARLANAAAVTGRSPADHGRLFDTVSLCLSKGLGAPVGSVLVGDAAAIARARVQRKRLGGGWRQAGVLAAAGLFALRNNVGRVVEDHESARAFAETLAAARPGVVDPSRVETNIVILTVPDAPATAAAAAERGVLLSVLNRRELRAVTHLDAPRERCVRAAALVADLIPA